MNNKQYAICYNTRFMDGGVDYQAIELFQKCGFTKQISSQIWCTENDGIKTIMLLKENLKKYATNDILEHIWGIHIFLIDEITKVELD